MISSQAVGIDLGTTYSTVAHLNERGEPVTIPNALGELATPSVVLIEGEKPLVGSEALQRAIVRPQHVIQNAKRYLGTSRKWEIDGKTYRPVDASTFILKELISTAQKKLGEIERAVVTVPAQFSDVQRHATVEAAHRAGLQQVDIINEPVAAALCYVLGTEGLWFTALAGEQHILVFDLGGGTFDLSLVKYEKNEVSVVASSGDLILGGIDWNQALERTIVQSFLEEFQKDPRERPQSMQSLAMEIEKTKRTLSTQQSSELLCRCNGHQKKYDVMREEFERLTKLLVDRTGEITLRMLKENDLGWRHIDTVLTTGGSTRMPMILRKIKEMCPAILNTSLSPDLSIAHGATYYAGMILSNNKFAKSILNKSAKRRLSKLKQKSVCARNLGILIRDEKTDKRVPFYFVPANTQLPADFTQEFGTVIPNQSRVNLQIVESGTAKDAEPVKIGSCIIDDLPPNLREGSEIAVTIHYDAQAKVHVTAKDVTSGKRANTEIIRTESVVPQLEADLVDTTALAPITDEVTLPRARSAPQLESQQLKPKQKQNKTVLKQPTTKKSSEKNASSRRSARTPQPVSKSSPPGKKMKPRLKRKTDSSPPKVRASRNLDDADRPIPLCNSCGEPLNAKGECPVCGELEKTIPKQRAIPPSRKATHKRRQVGEKKPVRRSEKDTRKSPTKNRQSVQPDEALRPLRKMKPKPKPTDDDDDEFWKIVEEDL